MRPDFPFPPIATGYLTFPSSVNRRRRTFRWAMVSNLVRWTLVPLNKPLGGVGGSGGRELEDLPRHPNHPSVLSDLDPDLHRLPLGIPAGRPRGTTVGKRCPSRYPARRCGRNKNTHLGGGPG